MRSGTRDAADTDRNLIRAIRAGVPVVARPYAKLASRLNLDETEMIERLARMRDRGIIKRIGLKPNLSALGINVSCMSAWDVAGEEIDRLAPWVAALSFVSRCCSCSRRPPQWRFNLMAMIHGGSREDISQKAARIARILGPASQASEILFVV